MCAMFVLFCAVCVVFASGRARPSGRSRRAWWRRLPRSTGKSRAAPSSTTRARRHRSCKRGHKKAPRALHSDRLHSGQVQFDVCIRPYSYKIQAQRKPSRSKVRNNKKMKRTENEQGNRGVLSVVYKCITLHSVHWRDVVSLLVFGATNERETPHTFCVQLRDRYRAWKPQWKEIGGCCCCVPAVWRLHSPATASSQHTNQKGIVTNEGK